MGAVTLTGAPTFTAGSGTLLTLAAITGTNTDLTFNGPGNTSVTGVIGTGTGNLTKSGTGTLTLNGLNTYNGVTAIQTGTLSINSVNTGSNAQALGTGTAVYLGVAATSSGTLVYTGGAGTLDKNINALGNGSDTVQNSGSGLLTLSGTLTKDGTKLTLSGGANGIKVTGSIVGASPNSDLDIGPGTTQLTADNPYNGPTSILTGGTLDLTTGGSISATTNVTVNTGGTLLLSGTNNNKINNSSLFTLAGGKITLGGSASLDEQVGALTLSGNSIIDFGTFAGGNTLRFADSSGAAWSAFTLSIHNWTRDFDHLYFGSVFGAGLTTGAGGQLGKILFYTDAGITPHGWRACHVWTLGR